MQIRLENSESSVTEIEGLICLYIVKSEAAESLFSLNIYK